METEKIIAMPTEYTLYGHVHTLLRKGEYGFLFEVKDEDGKVLAYEVFKKKISKAGMAKFGGGPARWVDSKERIPGNEAFGKWAWCLGNTGDVESTLAKANDYFEKLEEFKGDLKAFLNYRAPNPLLKVYELHDLNGQPISTKVMGKSVNKTVKINANDATEEKAIVAFQGLLGPAFDIRGHKAVLVGEEYKYGQTESEESTDDDDNDDE